MDYVLISDLARYYVVIVALWVIAVLVKVSYAKMRRLGLRCIFKRQEAPHSLSVFGLILFMFVSIIRRFETLGQPADHYVWIVSTAVTLVLVGVLLDVHFDLRPPWRREPTRR